MKAAIDPKLVVNHLLTQWIKRLSGAVDFWTVVCLDPVVVNPATWFAEQAEILRSLAVVIGSEVRGLKTSRRVVAASEELRFGCEQWLRAFQKLQDFRSASPEEILATCRELAQLYPALRDIVSRLGHLLGSPITFVEEMSTERSEYFDKILKTLPETLLAARATETADATP